MANRDHIRVSCARLMQLAVALVATASTSLKGLVGIASGIYKLNCDQSHTHFLYIGFSSVTTESALVLRALQA